MKLEYTPHNMDDVEVKIVTKLFEMLEEEGWVPVNVDDGGDDLVLITTCQRPQVPHVPHSRW